MTVQQSRRQFLKHSAWGVGLGTLWPTLSSSNPAPSPERASAEPLDADGPVLLFQGDSITDAGRARDNPSPNETRSLGVGYAGLAAGRVLSTQPERSWQCHNRGVSGNKVFQLAERWTTDTLDLTPDVVSILVGVNDFWHTLDGQYDGTVERYERDYRALLDRTIETLPDVSLILGEPFVLRGGTAVDDAWEPTFASYRQAARRVADDHADAWIPYQSIFDEALTQAPASYWAPDGVHPSLAGHTLMAEAWMGAFRSVDGE